MSPRIVIDTSVVVAGLRSNRGASFRLLSIVGQGRFQFCLSVPLVVEYEAAAKRQSRALGLTHADIDAFLDYICAVGEKRHVYFLWRPVLKDPGDDFVLELAVEAGCDSIVTHNVSDFDAATAFGVQVLTPAQFLRQIGELS